MREFRDTMGTELRMRRAEQAVLWMWRILEDSLMKHFKSNKIVREAMHGMEESVRRSNVPPSVAASSLLEKFLG